MKSKNLILMVVAVGCGLVAAFLTARLSNRSTAEYVDVLVAREQLVQGTELKSEKDDLDKQVMVKRFLKGTEPPAYVRDVEQLKGKRLNKTIREGDFFTEADLTGNRGIALPKGHTAMAIRVTADTATGGLILPGSRVHVMLSEERSIVMPNKGEKRIKESRLVLKDMLVVAVNAETNRPENQNGITHPTTVTLAVTPRQGVYLALAQKRGELSLQLRDPKEPPIKDDDTAADNAEEQTDFGVITSLPGDKKEDPVPLPPPAPKTVDVWVAKSDLPAGTKVDDPSKLFEKVPMLSQPENAVTDLSWLKGKTLFKPVFKHQFIPLVALDKPAEKPVGKPGVKPAPAPVVQAEPPSPPVGTLLIISGQSARAYAYNRDTNEFLVASPRRSKPAAPKPAPTPKPTEGAPTSSGAK